MANQSKRQKSGPFPWQVHPIWRGIGCAFLVIIPIISLGLADALLLLIEDPLPDILTRSLSLPGFGSVENFLARVVFALLISVVIYLILTVLGSFLYSLFGGTRTEEMAKSIRKEPFDR